MFHKAPSCLQLCSTSMSRIYPADDTLILTSCRSGTIVCNRLQLYLDALEDWADKWKIAINPGKSEAVLFTTRRVTPPQQVRFQGTAIPWRQQMKYLGLILDKKLT